MLTIDTIFPAPFALPSYQQAVAFELNLETQAAENEADFVRRIAVGDPEALAFVYDRYAPSLYRVLFAMLHSSADAEDALQEVFAKLATGRLGRVRDLKSFLFIVARNEGLTCLRRRKREPISESLEDSNLSETLADGAGESEPHYDWRTLLARLPLEQREVVVLKVWEGLTFAEIARVVKASPNTVMSRYRYGIERLRTWCQEDV